MSRGCRYGEAGLPPPATPAAGGGVVVGPVYARAPRAIGGALVVILRRPGRGDLAAPRRTNI